MAQDQKCDKGCHYGVGGYCQYLEWAGIEYTEQTTCNSPAEEAYKQDRDEMLRGRAY